MHACTCHSHLYVSSNPLHPSGVEFDDHITSMVELLSSNYTGSSTFEEEEGSEDASSQGDAGSLKTHTTHAAAAMNRRDLEAADDSDEDSADKLFVVDEGKDS